MSTTHLSEPFAAAAIVDPSIRRLGERTCVINVGTDLRHVELPTIDEAVRGLMQDECQDLVFDLTLPAPVRDVRARAPGARVGPARRVGLHDPRRRA